MNIIRLKDNFSHSELLLYISDIEKRYNARVLNIGHSVMNRSIPAIRLGNGRKNCLYVATHHGAEWITSLVLMNFVTEYLEKEEEMYKNSEKQKIFSKLYNTYTIWVIPLLNPDGAELQRFGPDMSSPIAERQLKMNMGSSDFSKWQANARGVDLNHNYDEGFSEYKKIETELDIPDGAPTKYSGRYPESEPEVSAICSLIRSFDFDLIITLHSQGEEIYYTTGGLCLPASFQIGKRLAKMTGYTLSEPTGTASYGGLTDWAISKMHIPSFTFECGLGENPLPPDCCFAIYERIRAALFAAPLIRGEI